MACLLRFFGFYELIFAGRARRRPDHARRRRYQFITKFVGRETGTCPPPRGSRDKNLSCNVRGDFAICRSCALRGAGVLVDPGAKRIWFSRMIQFVGSRAVPLPASQPILAQLLRTLKSHPGVVVRFEGHVNSTCGLECRGATGKPCKAARKVGSDMCARCPGGAYGLSKARAEAIKSFVAKCGVDVDRVYAVGFAGTRRLSDDITEEKGAVNRRVEVHMMPYAPPGRL